MGEDKPNPDRKRWYEGYVDVTLLRFSGVARYPG
jgi:hypothetical protein